MASKVVRTEQQNGLEIEFRRLVPLYNLDPLTDESKTYPDYINSTNILESFTQFQTEVGERLPSNWENSVQFGDYRYWTGRLTEEQRRSILIWRIEGISSSKTNPLLTSNLKLLRVLGTSGEDTHCFNKSDDLVRLSKKEDDSICTGMGGYFVLVIDPGWHTIQSLVVTAIRPLPLTYTTSDSRYWKYLYHESVHASTFVQAPELLRNTIWKEVGLSDTSYSFRFQVLVAADHVLLNGHQDRAGEKIFGNRVNQGSMQHLSSVASTLPEHRHRVVFTEFGNR